MFADYYLPGYKAGGPIRSVQSIFDGLKDDSDIYLITRDRDLGSSAPYNDVLTDQWTQFGGVKVMYKVGNQISLSFLKEISKDINPDVVHLNSLMSVRFSFIPLISIWLNKAFTGKVLLSPRGELSGGALNLKKFQKKIYLLLFRTLGFHKYVKWIASSDGEKSDILHKFGQSGIAVTRVDNLPNVSQWKTKLERETAKNSKQLKLVFFSRIARMKNLDFLLIALKDLDINVQLSIYGPQEDLEYFNICSKIVDELPTNISVDFLGALPPSEVYNILKEFDLFVLPTLGENFGQAIWEALASSVPVLISDRTPWKNLESHGVGWDLSLENSAEFKSVLMQMYELGEENHQEMRAKCRDFAFDYVANSNSLKSLKDLYTN